MGLIIAGKFSSSKSSGLLIVGNLCQQFSKHKTGFKKFVGSNSSELANSNNGTSLKMKMLELVRDIINLM